MNKEILSPPQLNEVIETVAKIDISEELFSKIADTTKKERLLVFISNHQGYAEVEMWTLVSKRIKSLNSQFNGLYWPYSAPAVAANVGNLFEKRKQYYKDKGLILLPVVRDSDEKHKIYKNHITEEMKGQNMKSLRTISSAHKNNCGLILTPEGSINGGRINKETQKINGIQEIEGKTLINLLLRGNYLKIADIIPVGVSGSYNVMNSENYQLAPDLQDRYLHQDTLMTLKAQEIISASSITHIQDYVTYLMQKVAALVPLEEQGYYAPKRVNLKNNF